MKELIFNKISEKHGVETANRFKESIEDTSKIKLLSFSEGQKIYMVCYNFSNTKPISELAYNVEFISYKHLLISHLKQLEKTVEQYKSNAPYIGKVENKIEFAVLLILFAVFVAFIFLINYLLP